MDDGSPELSLVIPVRDEAPNVAPLGAEIAVALEGRRFEVLFVDDGSRDGTFEEIRRAAARDPRIRGLRFRTGAGKAAAYAAGFHAARGSIVATLDGDLQDDPKDLPRLLGRLEAGDTDLVVGWKTGGKSSPATFFISRLVNFALRLVLRPKLHDMNCPVRVMRREVALGLDLRADLHRYIPLLAHARGFRVAEMPVANRARQHGASKYGGSKYFTSAVSLLGVGLYLRFGDRPMALFGGLGLLTLLAGFVIDAFYAVRYVVFGHSVDEDFPTVVLGVVLILIGTQFLSLGLLAEIMTRRLRAVEDRGGPGIAESL